MTKLSAAAQFGDFANGAQVSAASACSKSQHMRVPDLLIQQMHQCLTSSQWLVLD